MAATNGHPDAMEDMGAIYLEGSNGVSANLFKSRIYFETSLEIGLSSDSCCEGLLLLARKYLTENSEESRVSAKSILLLIMDLPSKDHTVFDRTDAIYHLGVLLFRENNDAQARHVFIKYLTTDGTQEVCR